MNIVAPLRDCGSIVDIILPEQRANLPRSLVYTNLVEQNPSFGEHSMRDIYIDRIATAERVELVRLPAGATIIGNSDFAVQVDSCLVEEQTFVGAAQKLNLSALNQFAGPTQDIAGECALIVRFGASTWGHWLGEILPRAVLLERSFPGRYRFVVPVWDTQSPWGEWYTAAVLGSLAAYGLSGERLIQILPGQSCRFDALHSITSVWSDHIMHPEAVAAMRLGLQIAIEPLFPNGGGRLALTRRPLAKRGMTNAHEVGQKLAEQDFTAVEIGRLSFSEQIGAFSSANTVFGTLGSDLTGLLYSPDGVTVISAAPAVFGDRFFFALVQARNGQYVDLRGPVIDLDDTIAHRSSFELDLDQLAIGLDKAVAVNLASKDAPSPSARVDPGMSDKQAPQHNDSWWSIPEHAGPDYTYLLSRLHSELHPTSYLEIGTLTGATLALANCDCIAIDPKFQVSSNVILNKPSCSFFQQGSDNFFANCNPEVVLGRKIDFAFLDGMHLYEFLLRDFMNVEKFCRPNSIIALHDCVPTDEHIARRGAGDTTFRDFSSKPDWWAGDVWKAVAILSKYRPDLRIRAFDAPPTGLVVITKLDPTNTVLDEVYFDAIDEFKHITLKEFGPQSYASKINLQSGKIFDTFEGIAEMFWL